MIRFGAFPPVPEEADTDTRCRVPRRNGQWRAVVLAPEKRDITNADGPRTALLNPAAFGKATLVVDLSRTRFCDTSGLHALVGASKRGSTVGTRLHCRATAAAWSAYPAQRILEVGAHSYAGELHAQDVGHVMFFIGLQYVVLEIGEQRADLRIHHLVLDVGVHRERLDYLPGKPSFRLDRLVPGGLKLAEQAARKRPAPIRARDLAAQPTLLRCAAGT
jgi:hypothetical protein